MATLGTTLFSLTPDFRRGRDHDLDPPAGRRRRLRSGPRGHRPPGLARLPRGLRGRRARLPRRRRPAGPRAGGARRLPPSVPAPRGAGGHRRDGRGPDGTAGDGEAARVPDRADPSRPGSRADPPGRRRGRAARRRPHLRGAGDRHPGRPRGRGRAGPPAGDRQPLPRAHHGLQRDLAGAARRPRPGVPSPGPGRGRDRRRPPDLGRGLADRPPHRHGARRRSPGTRRSSR